MISDYHPATDRRPLEGASLLLVEDDARLRRATRRFLELDGASLVDAADGEEAIHLLERDEAYLLDAVVTDLQIPVVSGRELIAVLEECRPDLPIVAITGYAPPLDFGAVPLLLKPFSPDDLVLTLGPLVLRSQEMRRRARQMRADAAESRSLARRQHSTAKQQHAKAGDLMAALQRQRAMRRSTRP
jgi:two-component system C4-dicarboxylate transport response regulator DctD